MGAIEKGRGSPGPFRQSWLCAKFDMPLENSQYLFETDSVPFLPIVLKGSVDYYAPYINQGYYTEDSLLKIMEYGAYPSFLTMQAENEKLIGTPSSDYFSIHMENWQEAIVSCYQQLNEVLQKIEGACIEEHRVLQKGVVRVRYSNGMTVYVNYLNEEYRDGSTVVAAKSGICVGDNTCSRAVTEIPNNDEYDKAVQESADRFGKMPTAEYLLKAATLATATARSGATAAALTYPVASSMLLHFLDWTGNTYALPSNFIKNTSDISTTRETVFNQLNGAYTTLRIPNITVYYGNINTVAYGGGSAVTDWKLSVNKCELWGKVTATGTVSKQTTLYVRDFYDWKAGDMNKIFDVAADLLNQCHYAGIARDFPVIGSTDY